MANFLEDADSQLRAAMTDAIRGGSDADPLALDLVRAILGDSQKGGITIKYILITALLAKATDDELDVFSLQKGDDSKGSYDARSLCHKVIVKYEQGQSLDLWGRSNEPFANQTARHPNIRLSPARRRDLHDVLIKVLEIVGTRDSRFARSLLSGALHFSINRAKERDLGKTYSYQAGSIESISDFIAKDGFGGAGLAAFVALCLSYIYPNHRIEVSRKNTSDVNSGLPGDVVVFDENDPVVIVEAKDRVVTAADVSHALSKARKYKCVPLFVSTKSHKTSVRSAILDLKILVSLASPAFSRSEFRDAALRFEKYLALAATAQGGEGDVGASSEVSAFRRWVQAR